jgi:hypothetical protein
MTGTRPEMGAASWTERYESLRRYVLEGRERLQSQPLGLALWVAKGMAGWMGQWSQLVAPVGGTTAMAWPRVSASSWQQPLTVLLAQITLQHLEPRVSL